MTSYEKCRVCHGREAFNLGPCDQCKFKSASIETREINGVQYHALKGTKSAAKQEKPSFITVHELMFGKIQAELE